MRGASHLNERWSHHTSCHGKLTPPPPPPACATHPHHPSLLPPSGLPHHQQHASNSAPDTATCSTLAATPRGAAPVPDANAARNRGGPPAGTSLTSSSTTRSLPWSATSSVGVAPAGPWRVKHSKPDTPSPARKPRTKSNFRGPEPCASTTGHRANTAAGTPGCTGTWQRETLGRHTWRPGKTVVSKHGVEGAQARGAPH